MERPNSSVADHPKTHPGPLDRASRCRGRIVIATSKSDKASPLPLLLSAEFTPDLIAIRRTAPFVGDPMKVRNARSVQSTLPVAIQQQGPEADRRGSRHIVADVIPHRQNTVRREIQTLASYPIKFRM